MSMNVTDSSSKLKLLLNSEKIMDLNTTRKTLRPIPIDLHHKCTINSHY